MKEGMFRKGLTIGIIFLLFLVNSPIMIGNTVQKENRTSDASNMTKQGKPDLKLIGASIWYTNHGFPVCDITIWNCGDAAIPTGRIEVSMTIKKSLLPKTLCSTGDTFGLINPFDSGESGVLSIDMCLDNIPFLFFGRIFFKVDPNNLIDESNERNNGAWTEISGIVWYCEDMALCFLGLGILKQWKTSNVGITYFPS